jgi:hypothetical protein
MAMLPSWRPFQPVPDRVFQRLVDCPEPSMKRCLRDLLPLDRLGGPSSAFADELSCFFNANALAALWWPETFVHGCDQRFGFRKFISLQPFPNILAFFRSQLWQFFENSLMLIALPELIDFPDWSPVERKFRPLTALRTPEEYSLVSLEKRKSPAIILPVFASNRDWIDTGAVI